MDIFHASILIVDDEQANVVLLERVLHRAGYTSVAFTTDPAAVLELHRQNQYDLILLDIQMPGMDGFQVMDGLHESKAGGYLPVLVITAHLSHKLRALKAGARDFISKPFEIPEVLARVRNMLEVRLLQKELRCQNDRLEQRVQVRTAELREGYIETIFTMTRAAEYKDKDTGSHVQRVSFYSHALACTLGMDKEFVDMIFIASPMHDIGKIGIPDHVLLKPGGFTPDEWAVMTSHAEMGAKILGISNSPYLKMGVEIALGHHERWDGGGYPYGQKGEHISLAARILNMGDIYDALRSKRPYKPALDHSTAVKIITLGDCRTRPEHFDPAILAAFLQNHAAFQDIFETVRGMDPTAACSCPLPGYDPFSLLT